MKSNLPQGWSLTTLGAICQKAESVSPTNNPQSKFHYIDIASIDNSIYRVVDAKEYSGKDAPSRARQLVYTADTLISTVRPYLRKIAFVTEELNEQIASTGFTVVRAKEGIDPKYVFYNAISDGFINSLCEKQRGASYPAVRDSDVFEQQIPLPPLAEQRRIVAQLDATIQKLEASQERLDKLPILLKQFRQAVLAAAVAGRLTAAWRAENPQQETGADLLAQIRAEHRAQWEAKQRTKLKGKQLSLNDNWKQKYEEPTEPDTSDLSELPEGWVWNRLDNVAEMCLGKMLDAAKNQGKLEPYLGNINVRWGTFDLSDLKSMRFTENEDERYSVIKGDVVICEGGEPGRAAIWEADYSIKIQKALHRVRPFANILESHFFYFCLRLDVEQGRLTNYFTGTGIQHFTGKALAQYVFPIPPLIEQQEIVRQVNHYFALADALEARFEQAAALVEQLPQALLAKAFSGQLVPQDPNDEPASILLERLRNAPIPAKVKRERVSKFTVNKDSDVPQPLLDILTQHPDGISPEKLFSLAGFTDVDVDAFYQELAALRPRLVEDKPIGEAAKTWPKTSAALRLKPEPHAD